MSEPEGRGLNVTAAVLTDVGRQRDNNEDSVRFFNPGGSSLLTGKGVLAVVADGMGGHAAGDVASQMAAEAVGRRYFAASEEPHEALRLALEAANREVFERASQDASLSSMGTTCTALALREGAAYMAHVGDSRLYLLRGGDIYRMSEDDSAVMELVKEGSLDSKEARTHEDRNVIVRALGTQEKVEVSTWKAPLAIRPGDGFVLSSDGLHDLVEDDEIRAISLATEPHGAAQKLIEEANGRGGHDNISVAVLRIEAAGERAVPGATREVSAIQ